MYSFIIFLVILNFIFLYYFKNFAKLYGLYDVPNKRKIHQVSTPLIGGFYFFINLSFLFLFSTISLNFNSLNLDMVDKNILSLFNYFFFLIIFIIGFLDDKNDLSPNIKLSILFLLIYIFLNFNESFVIKFLNFSFIDFQLSLGSYDIFFTTLCFLLFINACNMFDGLNLQTGIYLTSVIFYFFSFSQSLLIIVISISILFFLILNFKGKIFMGDSGIYLYSFAISLIFVHLYNDRSIIYADTIFLIMMVPGIDMFRLFIVRILKKQNPFQADKNHIHHLLLNNYNYKKTIKILSIIIYIPLFLIKIELSNVMILLIYMFIYCYLIFNLKYKNVN